MFLTSQPRSSISDLACLMTSMPPDRLSSYGSRKTLRQPRRNAPIPTTLCHPRAISFGRARYTFLITATCALLSFSRRMITTLQVTLV